MLDISELPISFGENIRLQNIKTATTSIAPIVIQTKPATSEVRRHDLPLSSVAGAPRAFGAVCVTHRKKEET